MTSAITDAGAAGSFTAAVAEELRAHLARRRITGRELARRLHVSAQWVSQRTRGSVAMNTDDLERISEALGMTPMQLLSGVVIGAATSGVSAGYPARNARSVAPLSLVRDTNAARVTRCDRLGRLTEEVSAA